MDETAREITYRHEEAVRRMFPHMVNVHRWLAKASTVAFIRIRSQVEGWDRRRLKRELRKRERSTYHKTPTPPRQSGSV